MDKHIYLCGFMGSGKTTIGRLLAKRINRRFVDTDEEIEKVTGISVAEIFNKSGEPEFRRIEKELIRKIASEKDPAIIALGGGSLMDEESLKVAKQTGILIYLKCSTDVLKQRLRNSTRPLLKTDNMESLLEKRIPGFRMADKSFSTQSDQFEEIVENLCTELSISVNNYINTWKPDNVK